MPQNNAERLWEEALHTPSLDRFGTLLGVRITFRGFGILAQLAIERQQAATETWPRFVLNSRGATVPTKRDVKTMIPVYGSRVR